MRAFLGHMEAKEPHFGALIGTSRARHLPVLYKDAQCHEFKRILTQNGWYPIILRVLQVTI